MAKKKKQLTGLAAALVNAGHMNDKQARKLQREQKREDRQIGEEGVEARKAEERAAIAARRAEEEQQKRVAEGAASSAAARGLVREHAASGWQGRRQWFYVRRDQQISYVSVSDEMARLLRGGQVAIVEGFDHDAGEHFLVRDPIVIGRIRLEDASRVRFWNQAELEREAE